MIEEKYIHQAPFVLESGISLPKIEIAYTTHGQLNETKSNVIWVFHALTANQNPLEWWPGLFGTNDFFSPTKYFIVCANVLGGCYGSTGPSITDLPAHLHLGNFPLITIRDIVKAHQLLQKHLNIDAVHIAIGGSFGGYQALEFAYQNTSLEHLILIATAVHESPWNIAIHETQRQAMRADANFDMGQDTFSKGLSAARGIGMLTYRTPQSFAITQPRDEGQLSDFKASSYIRYQGEKLTKRFSPWTYYKLTETLDTHDFGRNRNSLENSLKQISAKTLSIGIEEDLLANCEELRKNIAHILNSQHIDIQSAYGHDGFLLETEQLTIIINQFLN